MVDLGLDFHRFCMLLISACLLFQLATGIIDILFLSNILQTNTVCQNYWQYIVPSAILDITFSIISLISVRIIMRNTYVNRIRNVRSINISSSPNNIVTEYLDFTNFEITILIISAIGQIFLLLWSICVFFIASTPCNAIYPITNNTTHQYTYAPQSVQIYYGFHFGMMLLSFLVLGTSTVGFLISWIIFLCTSGPDPLQQQPSEQVHN